MPLIGVRRALIKRATSGPVAGPQAAAFLARTSGLDTTHTNAYINLINGLVSDGVWAKLDTLYIFATQTAATAQLSLVSATFNVSLTNAPTFTTDRGYTGNGTNQNISTNFNPTTASSPLYQQNDAHFSFWNLTNLAANGNPSMGGIDTNIALYLNFSGADCFTRVNDNGGSVTIGNPQGHILGTRSAAGTRTTYQSGTSLGSVSVASAAPGNATIVILGDGSGFSTYQCAGASIGGGLTGTDVTNFYNRLRTYMTVVGVP